VACSHAGARAGQRHINLFTLSYRVLATDALAKLVVWAAASASARCNGAVMLEFHDLKI
jgi:hypothetical protein